MHITGMTIRGIPPFTEPVEFEFNERVNLLIGPNATGKSTIIRSLAARASSRIHRDEDTTLSYFRAFGGDSATSGDFIRHAQIDRVRKQQPFVVIPATRINLPLQDDNTAMFGLLDQRNNTHDLDVCLKDSLHVFNGSDVYCAMNVVATLVQGTAITEDTARALFMIKKISLECTYSISHEVLANNQLTDYVGIQKILATSPSRHDLDVGRTTVVHYSMGASVNDGVGMGSDEEVFVGDLSGGTQGTLLWVWYLTLRIARFYEFEGGWEKRPAILLIDEIENHLHPTWQRRVIPALLEHFPGLQIFATTHSPFVVAGLMAGQVHLLHRDANGVITATTNEQDIIGWTTDEILRTFMDVDEPTDELTVRRASRLRELREKDSLTDDEETELQELRRQVNEDLLSRGPLNAQRERYADLMQRFLLSRQSELSQDGD